MCTGHSHRRAVDMPGLISRRTLLRGAAGVAALGATQAFAAPAAFAATCTGTVPIDEISIQLYTMRTAMDQDLDGTLSALYNLGYRKVEEAGYHGRTAAQFKAALDKAGLKSTSTHKNIPYPFDEDAWRTIVANAKLLGQTRIVEPLPLILLPILVGGLVTPPGVPKPNLPMAVYADYAHTANQAAAIAKEEGIAVGYHNHNPEFIPLVDDPIEGRCDYDILLAETDPDLVHFEMDIYWVWAGDRDPVDFLEKYPHRFRQFHVKDMDESGAITAPGQGVIDFARVFTAGKANQDIAEFIIEDDSAADAQGGPITSARLGYELLRNITYTYQKATCGTAPAPAPSTPGNPTTPGEPSTPGRGGPTIPTTGLGSGLATLATAGIGAALALRRRSSAIEGAHHD